MTTWRIQQLRAFIDALHNQFNGTVVWMTQSKQATRDENNFHADSDHFFGDERTKRLDMEVIPVVQAETDWTIYDRYHITEPLA